MTARGFVALSVVALVAQACAAELPEEPRATSAQHASHGEGEPPAERQHDAHGAPASAVTETPPGMAIVEVARERVQGLGVRTARVERRALMRTIRAVAIVAPDERLVRKIQTRVSGWIEELLVAFTGARVRAGEPIVSIYSPEVVATEREYLLSLRALRGASAEGTEARGLLDSARTRLLYWGLSPKQLRDLERSGAPQRAVVLHSPIGGIVTWKPVYQGMYVTPEMELYTVTDLSRVWIWAEVFENDIDVVQLGQVAIIRLQGSPGFERRGAVSFVSPTLSPATRTLRVRFEAGNSDGALKPGQYATVELDVPLGDALALPADAIIRTGDRDLVFVETAHGRYAPRQVRLGRRAGDVFEVRDGLAEGDRVVVSSQFLFDSESRLRAADSGPAHGGH